MYPALATSTRFYDLRVRLVLRAAIPHVLSLTAMAVPETVCLSQALGQYLQSCSADRVLQLSVTMMLMEAVESSVVASDSAEYSGTRYLITSNICEQVSGSLDRL